MRFTLLLVSMAGQMLGQSMTEAAAAVAGGTIGGVAGKKVSSGIDQVFRKVDQQMKQAAVDTRTSRPSSQPAIQVGPGAPRTDSVPPPPPIRTARQSSRVERPSVPEVAFVPAPVQQIPPPPPKPPVTVAELNQLTAGMSREDVLKLGTPAARITMIEDGHLVEVYRYADRDTTVGAVKLSDGSVSSVIVRR
jgi:hypothetical protein